jgi:hypothetical protein
MEAGRRCWLHNFTWVNLFFDLILRKTGAVEL